MPAISEAFVAEWDAGDALGYYGAILSFIGTVVLGALALYQNRIIKTEADKKAALAEEQFSYITTESGFTHQIRTDCRRSSTEIG